MDTSKAKKSGKKAEETKEREFITLSDYEVSNARVIETSRGDMVLFTLRINGVTIYDCRVATGKNGDFISFPQYKGKNGVYYNTAYAQLSEEDTKIILEDVQNAINKED